MHIAFLTPEYPTAKTGNSGGLGTSIYNLSNAMIQQGVDISIFVYGQLEDEDYIENKIHFYRIRNIIFKGLSWFLTRKKVETLINSVHKKSPINFVEVTDWTGFSAWMNFQFPVVMRLNGSDTFFCHIDQRPVKWWNKFQEKVAYSQANYVIAVSDFVGLLTNKIFNKTRNYVVIPNSIDTKKFVFNNSEVNENLILYFGTLVRKKGVLEIPHIFNEVVRNHTNVKLLLIGVDSADIYSGSSSTWELMRSQFSQQAIQRVNYIGKKPYTEIKNYIQKASVCIFPSYAEALPVSWLEAMSMGKAIVASNIGWANEMIENGKEGFLVNPSDHTIFSQKILKILNNQFLRIEIGDNARKKVETVFASDILSLINLEYYKKLLEK